MNRTVKITLLATVAALAAGCGTTAQSPAPAQSPGHTQSPGQTPSPSPTHGGQVGDKFTVTSGDTKYDVTLLHVDQQAQPESEYASAQPGHRLTAAQFRVTAITSTNENANVSATVTGSNEQSYAASIQPVAAGTNFASGQITLQPGSSLVGWVTFELPHGVQISKVQWAPLTGLGTHRAEWTVNSSAATSPGSTPTAPSSPGGGAPGQATNPADTVRAYFDAINQRNYQKAWELGGKNTTSSYSSFVSGFRTTQMVSVEIQDVSGDIGTGVVTARLDTLETDGSTKAYQGTYTVRNGVIVQFNVRQVS